MVGSYGNFHSKQARVLDMWISGYCLTVESPQIIDKKSKYFAKTIVTNFINFKTIVLVFTLISKPLTNRWQ